MEVGRSMGDNQKPSAILGPKTICYFSEKQMVFGGLGTLLGPKLTLWFGCGGLQISVCV